VEGDAHQALRAAHHYERVSLCARRTVRAAPRAASACHCARGKGQAAHH
jgi:hypothetical protein